MSSASLDQRDSVALPPARVRPWALIRRRWWVILLVVAAAAATASLVAGIQRESYTAQALAVVPAGSSSKAAGSANDAKTLAATYAALIPEDERIVRAVARDTGMTPQKVDDGISVLNTSDTALLELGFSDAKAGTAARAARSLAHAVSDGTSRNVPRRTVGIVRLPSRVAGSSAGGSERALLPIGAILGLFLGAVLAVFLERADARVDDDRDLELETGLASTSLDTPSLLRQIALLDRWQALSPSDPARIALVAATRDSERAAVGAAKALAGAAREKGRAAVVQPSGVSTTPATVPAAGPAANGDASVATEERGAGLVLMPTAGPNGDPSVESVAISSHVAVLVARKGSRARDVRRRLSRLRSLGVDVERVLLVPRQLRPTRGGPVRNGR